MESKKRKFILGLQKKPALRRESGLFVADGPKILSEINPALVDEIFVTDAFLKGRAYGSCSRILKEKGFTLVSEGEMGQISDTVSPQGILATVYIKKPESLESFLEQEREYAVRYNLGEPLILVLQTIQDPGNLGTIIRSAEAAGATGIIADGMTADLYSPKTVRSTLGALLRLPFITVPSLLEAVSSLKEGSPAGRGGIKAYAAAPGGAGKYTEISFKGPSAVMIGNESRGLSSELISMADSSILIPMHAGAESLNAAVAASVILFEAERQRAAQQFSGKDI